MQDWTSDTLWAKSKEYCGFAFNSEPNSALFPLLASFSLELLGKAALAKIHPVLIADPRGEGNSVLYAFGVPTRTPHTIVAKSVFSRPTQLVPAFTAEDEDACLLLAERRNRELHTGVFAFADYNSGEWLDDFYRVAKVLCDFLGRDVAELLGKELGAEAEEAAKQGRVKAETKVYRFVAEAQARFNALRPTEVAERGKSLAMSYSWHYDGSQTFAVTECPACKQKALLTVKLVAERPAEIDGDTIYQTDILSPRALRCPVCDLELSGTAELRVVKLAGQLTRTYESTPVDYFDIKPEHVVDMDPYGND